jgi:hypothetical protein
MDFPALGLVALGVAIVSGILWAVAKFFSKVAMVAIPIIAGVVAGLINGGVTEDTSRIVRILSTIAVAAVGTIGVVGTLSCTLFAQVRDIQKEVEELKQD